MHIKVHAVYANDAGDQLDLVGDDGVHLLSFRDQGKGLVQLQLASGGATYTLDDEVRTIITLFCAAATIRALFPSAPRRPWLSTKE